MQSTNESAPPELRLLAEALEDLPVATRVRRTADAELLLENRVAREIGRAASALSWRDRRLAEGDYVLEIAEPGASSASTRDEHLDALGALFGLLAHDFNNLLAVVKLLVSDLRKRVIDPQQRGSLMAIEQATDGGIDLTRGLLDFSRRGRHLTQRIDLHELLRAIAVREDEHLRPSHTLALDLGATRAAVLGDATLLEQVVVALLDNAREATPQGGALGLATSDGPDDTLVLQVTDDGPGIAEAIRDRVFEPYFSTKESGKNGERPGLGLSRAYGIVRSHGGHIAIANQSPHGGRVLVTLPRA